MATTLRGRPVDPYALPPEAGTRPNYGNERTSECLVDEDRPPTPDRYKKWRKSTYSVPGTRIIHPGGVDDWRDVKHPEFFGVRKKDPGEGEHVDDVLAQPGAESEYAQTKLTQAERHYHSTRMEPLGKCFSHGHVLPEECRTREHKFGKSTITPGGNDSKTLIYMPSAKPVPGERAQYIKSHGSYGPGEQRSRDYDWKGCDLKTHRFGEGVGSYVALNGLALGATAAMEQLDPQPIISQRMRNFKALQDKLGQSRYLGHTGAYQFGKMHRYGKKSVRGEGEWDARQCIAGDYAPEDCEPEPELGKTLTPGYRNILTEKSRHRPSACLPSERTSRSTPSGPSPTPKIMETTLPARSCSTRPPCRRWALMTTSLRICGTRTTSGPSSRPRAPNSGTASTSSYDDVFRKRDAPSRRSTRRLRTSSKVFSNGPCRSRQLLRRDAVLVDDAGTRRRGPPGAGSRQSRRTTSDGGRR